MDFVLKAIIIIIIKLLLLLMNYYYLYLLYIGIHSYVPRQSMSLGDTLLQLSFVLLSIRGTGRISLVPTLVLMVFYVSTFRGIYYYCYYYCCWWWWCWWGG